MSTLRATLVQPRSTGPAISNMAARAPAWAYFSSNITPPSNMASLNVASLTDAGVGNVDTNWTALFAVPTAAAGAGMSAGNRLTVSLDPAWATYAKFNLYYIHQTFTLVDGYMNGVFWGALA